MLSDAASPVLKAECLVHHTMGNCCPGDGVCMVKTIQKQAGESLTYTHER